MTPALERRLRGAFRTADLGGLERIDRPWDDRVVFRLDGRQVELTGHVMLRLDPPSPDLMMEGLMVMFGTLWDCEKRWAREEGREPSPSAIWDRMQEHES